MTKVFKITATARKELESIKAAAKPSRVECKPNLDDENFHHYEHLDTFFDKGCQSTYDRSNRLLEDGSVWENSQTEPVNVSTHYPENHEYPWPRWKGTIFLYQDCLYDVRGQFREDQKRLLVKGEADKERVQFERLRAKFESPEAKKSKRERIPDKVRIAVWQRDQGKCSRCSSNEKLEYDHIIPISKNGSNTARNIELLCEACNRKKHDNIM